MRPVKIRPIASSTPTAIFLSVESYDTSRTELSGLEPTRNSDSRPFGVNGSLCDWITRRATMSLSRRLVIVCVNGCTELPNCGWKKPLPWPTTIFIEAW